MQTFLNNIGPILGLILTLPYGLKAIRSKKLWHEGVACLLMALFFGYKGYKNIEKKGALVEPVKVHSKR